jgi:hypothetical protein
MLRLGLLLALVIVAAPSMATAQSIKSMLQDYGLLGVWAADCGRKMSSTNPHARYSMSPSGDGLLFSRAGEARSDSIYIIYGAERLPDGKLLLHEQREEDGAMFEVVLEKEQDKLLVWSMQPHDQVPQVTNAILAATGKRGASLARCDGMPSDLGKNGQQRISPAAH